MEKQYTKHEIAVRQIIREEINPFVGGYENQLMDFDEGSDEYNDAYNFLYKTPAKEMMSYFYDLVMNCCKAGSNAEHARFAGSEFIKVSLYAYIIKNKISLEFAEPII